MSRLISLAVGLYLGFVLDQNFEIPKLPVPQQMVDEIKKLTGKPEDNKKK